VHVGCRSCGHADLLPVVDLGETPIANVLPEADSEPSSELRYPLEVVFCSKCALVQLVHDVPELFPDDYPYFSSFSDALIEHSRRHVDRLVELRGLDASSFVVEVASNDGYLLSGFVDHGVPALGVDAAPGPVEVARELGVDTVCGFFGRDLARRIRSERGCADVIIANNVLAHVPDLDDFVGGIELLLSEGGVVTIENPGVRDLILHREFDTVYHEHVCYYSCHSVAVLMGAHGLHVQDVDYFPDLHGGTLRWWIGRADQQSDGARRSFADELERGMTEHGFYASFGDAVMENRLKLRELVEKLKADGARIAGYGAAAKGATLLNFADLGTDMIDFVVDRNTHKQGRLMPGTRQLILPPEALIEQQPDYLLLLAWNFRDEIVAQQSEYAERGGQFIVPVPTPSVVGT
jgi:SAM-dependent methyltransferase